MTDEWNLPIHGFRIQDPDRVGIEGSIPLSGVTVLFGRNGAGKSLVIEYLESLLSPPGELRGRQEADEPDDYYGWLYLDPHAGDRQEAAAYWLRDLVARCHYDVGSDGGASARELAAALDESGWPGLVDALASDLPANSIATVAFLHDVVSSALLAYQRLDYGSVDLALSWSSAERLRSQAVAVLDGTIGEADPPPDETVAHRIATTISQSSSQLSGYVHITALVAFEERRRPGHHPGGLLRSDHPTVVWIRDDPQDLEQVIDAALGSQRWLVDEVKDILVFGGSAWDRLRAIEARANKITPRFVRDCGSIVLSPFRGDHDVQPGIAVRFALAAEGETVGYRHLGAGIRRWVGASLIVACAEHEPRLNRSPLGQPQGPPSVGSGQVLLVDEPELHVHPAAQRDIAEWLVRRNREGAVVLAASHAPAMLNLPSDLASFVAVVRNDGRTTLYDIGADILDEVDTGAEMLGFDRHAWLHAVRGVLVVEGQHDMRVIRHFFGGELAAARVLPLPLRGSGNVMAMIESEFLGRAHVPMRIMFDHTAADAFRAGAMPNRSRTPEERKLVQFLNQRRAGMDVEPIGYAEPDILCALPEDAVRRAYEDAKFDSWQTIIDDWTARRDKPGFKAYALKHMRIQHTPDEFLDQVLLHVRPNDKPSGALCQAVDSAIASLVPS